MPAPSFERDAVRLFESLGIAHEWAARYAYGLAEEGWLAKAGGDWKRAALAWLSEEVDTNWGSTRDRNVAKAATLRTQGDNDLADEIESYAYAPRWQKLDIDAELWAGYAGKRTSRIRGAEDAKEAALSLAAHAEIDASLSEDAKLVLAALAARTAETGWLEVLGTRDHLIRVTGLTERRVRTSLTTLEAFGYLKARQQVSEIHSTRLRAYVQQRQRERKGGRPPKVYLLADSIPEQLDFEPVGDLDAFRSLVASRAATKTTTTTPSRVEVEEEGGDHPSPSTGQPASIGLASLGGNTQGASRATRATQAPDAAATEIPPHEDPPGFWIDWSAGDNNRPSDNDLTWCGGLFDDGSMSPEHRWEAGTCLLCGRTA